MASPLVAAGIGLTAIIAMGAIMGLSSEQMNYSTMAQDSFDIANDRIKESLDVTLNGNDIDIKNNWEKHSKIKEIRVLEKNTDDVISRKIFQKELIAASEVMQNNVKLLLSPANDVERKVAAFNTKQIPANSLGVTNVSDKQVRIVTELGNVFTMKQGTNEQGSDDGTGDGNSNLDGIGYQARLYQIDHNGRITHGAGVSGIDESLTPYLAVPTTTEFAAVVLDGDPKTTYTIPEFASEYTFSDSGSLEQVINTKPNILGFSFSKDITGSVTVTNGNEITFSGNGKMLVELNNLGEQQTLLRGNVGSGGKIRIVESPYDLFSLTYVDGKGFEVCEENRSTSENGVVATKHNHYSYSTGKQWHYHISLPYQAQFDFPMNTCLLGQEGTHTATFDYTRNYGHGEPPCCAGMNNGHSSGTYSGKYIVTSTITGSQNLGVTSQDNGGDGYNNVAGTTGQGSHGSYSGPVRIYDTLPTKDLMEFTTNFEQFYQFPAGTTYLLVEPNGQTVTIKAETYDSGTSSLLEITGLSANTPYQISKNGFVGATGITSGSGAILLTSSNLDIGDDTSPGGILTLFPESSSYRGPFSTVVFDLLNDETLHTNSSEDVTYSSSAYVKIPIASKMNIESVALDDLSLSYLTGQYPTGSEIDIPIIPSKKNILMQINGTEVAITISDVLGDTGIKLITPQTSTISDYSTDGKIVGIAADASTETFTIAAHPGTMSALIEVSVSGSAKFTLNTQFAEQYSAPPYRCHPGFDSYKPCLYWINTNEMQQAIDAAAEVTSAQQADANYISSLESAMTIGGPLTVFVDVFKNGQYIKSEEIYIDKMPVITPAATVNGGMVAQSIKLDYSQGNAIGVVTVEGVDTGDLVEFSLRARLQAAGIPTPNAPSSQDPSSSYDDGSSIGFAEATTTLHGGSIFTDIG